MPSNDSVMINYSEGRTNLGRAKNKILSWRDFCHMMSMPTKTKEKRRVFDQMTKEEQDELKAVDGWIMAAPLIDGKRRRTALRDRVLLSLDYDYATPDLLERIDLGLTPLSAHEFFVHSSRRHTAEKPRIRLFAPLARPINIDEFIALGRILAARMEGGSPMRMVDKVSFRAAQMMFKPTISADGDWYCRRNTGSLIDPDAILEGFAAETGDWRNLTLLPVCADEEDLRKTADKAEDPTTKRGPVGDFCRAYDVPAAIEKFLPDTYAPADDYSAKPRYTYLKGTSTSGAVVEDDGLFLYSHHGSDPCADRLVNAFDLVRIHLFGDLDEDSPKDTGPTKWPSYKKMVEFIREDDDYRRSQAESRYDISAMFADVVEEVEEVETPKQRASVIARPSVAVVKRERPKPLAPTEWFPQALEVDQNGKVASSAPNAAVIVYNDARMFRAIAFNDFSKQIVAVRSIKSKLDIAPEFICTDPINGERWQDINDITLRMILEAPNGEGKVGYGMRMTDRDLNAAVISAAHRNKFHPVREYFEACAEAWDGESRIDTLLIRYIGVPDTAYHREIIRWKIIASVTRIFEPGHKFDYAIILQGPTGKRKSSFVKALYGEEWFGELDCKLDDKQQIAETIAGKSVLELPELSGFHKSDFNAAKVFMRKQFDDVRMAYDRRTSEFPRQCVFWGTTNDHKFLKDPTGNRSYWPVHVNVKMIDTDAVAAERDQLWGEAVHLYREMRRKKPRGDLALTLQSIEAQTEALTLQEAARSQELHEMWAEKIADWLNTPVRLSEYLREIGANTNAELFENDEAMNQWVLRCAFHREHVVEHALMRDRGVGDYQTAQTVERAIPLIPGWHQPGDKIRGGARVRVQGIQKRWYFRIGITRDEAYQGYRVVDADWTPPEKYHDDAFDELIGTIDESGGLI